MKIKTNAERCLDPDEKPAEVLSLWNVDPKKKETGKETLKELTNALIFKKKIFLRDDEKELQDPIAKLFVFHQVFVKIHYRKHHLWNECNKFFFLLGRGECHWFRITLLSGWCRQTCGSQMPNQFRRSQTCNSCCWFSDVSCSHSFFQLIHFGFANSQQLKNFVPKDLLPNKKTSEWETLILKAHSQNIGKSADEAMTEYLNIVKEWPFYGTTFFPPCKTINIKKLPAKVLIGVNADGILVLKKDKVLQKKKTTREKLGFAFVDCLFFFFFAFRNVFPHIHLPRFVHGLLLQPLLHLNLELKRNLKSTLLKHGRVPSSLPQFKPTLIFWSKSSRMVRTKPRIEFVSLYSLQIDFI